jgi:hypothetical protein
MRTTGLGFSLVIFAQHGEPGVIEDDCPGLLLLGLQADELQVAQSAYQFKRASSRPRSGSNSRWYLRRSGRAAVPDG